MTWLSGLALAAALLIANDTGGPVTPAQAAQIAPEATTNLQALLRDRPEMLMLLQPHDDVWMWLVVHFSNSGWTIRWSDNQATLEHYLARHTYTADGHPVIFIARHLKSGARISAEAQLSGLVFELLNAEHENEFKELAARARNGAIERPAFILANAQIEFTVCRATQKFYRTVWRPHVLRCHLHDQGGNWHLGAGDDFARWIAYHRQDRRDGYPDDVYGPEYDAISAQRHAAEKAPATFSAETQK